MTYETVNLKEKTVVGLSARTNNSSPEMKKIIGRLWQKFYLPEICANIKKQGEPKSLGHIHRL